MKAGEAVFVDTGAWIALALTRDPLHARARETSEDLMSAGARPHASDAVVMETFTFLDRNASRPVALTWRASLNAVPRLKILPCTSKDLERAWRYFERADLHKLSAVAAVSFVLMTDRRVRATFAFDTHFAAAGFRMLG